MYEEQGSMESHRTSMLFRSHLQVKQFPNNSLCQTALYKELALLSNVTCLRWIGISQRRREMGNIKTQNTLLEDFIEKAGGCAVTDGGFATQLERHGASINDPLWSALCLIKDPHLIKKVSSLYPLPNFCFIVLIFSFAFLCCSRSWSEMGLSRFIWNTWRRVQIYWWLRLTRYICESAFTVLGSIYFCSTQPAFVLFPTVSSTNKDRVNVWIRLWNIQFV